MERRLGRIQATHSQVNDLYEIALRESPRAFVFFGRSKQIARSGADCGRALTCCVPICMPAQPKNSGSQYMQLTEAEASFRAPKSELSIRPLFHQKEPRVKAHVIVAFLGYALWVTLKHALKRRPAIASHLSSTDRAHR